MVNQVRNLFGNNSLQGTDIRNKKRKVREEQVNNLIDEHGIILQTKIPLTENLKTKKINIEKATEVEFNDLQKKPTAAKTYEELIQKLNELHQEIVSGDNNNDLIKKVGQWLNVNLSWFYFKHMGKESSLTRDQIEQAHEKIALICYYVGKKRETPYSKKLQALIIRILPKTFNCLPDLVQFNTFKFLPAGSAKEAEKSLNVILEAISKASTNSKAFIGLKPIADWIDQQEVPLFWLISLGKPAIKELIPLLKKRVDLYGYFHSLDKNNFKTGTWNMYVKEQDRYAVCYQVWSAQDVCDLLESINSNIPSLSISEDLIPLLPKKFYKFLPYRQKSLEVIRNEYASMTQENESLKLLADWINNKRIPLDFMDLLSSKGMMKKILPLLKHVDVSGWKSYYKENEIFDLIGKASNNIISLVIDGPIKSLPENLYNLEHLKCTSCYDLANVPYYPHLKSLVLSACTSLKQLQVYPELTFLRCEICPKLTFLPELSELRELIVRDCSMLTFLSELHKLTKMELTHCESLTNIPKFPKLSD